MGSHVKKAKENTTTSSFIEKLLLAAAFVAIVSGVVIISVFLIQLSHSYEVSISNGVLLPESAQVGDFIGGFVGALWSIAGVMLFYLALRTQQREFAAQREQLDFHRLELSSQREEFAVNRITQVIYQQLELCTKAIERLDYTPVNESIVNGEEVFAKLRQTYRNASVERTIPLEELLHFHYHSMEPKTRDFLRTLNHSLEIIQGLVEQKNNENDEFLMSKDNRKYLLYLFMGNLNIVSISGYVSNIQSIHQSCMSVAGAPADLKVQAIGTVEWLERIIGKLRHMVVESGWDV